MKSYKCTEYIARVAAYLIATGKPFNFDGFAIEFTASEEYVTNMLCEDKALRLAPPQEI